MKRYTEVQLKNMRKTQLTNLVLEHQKIAVVQAAKAVGHGAGATADTIRTGVSTALSFLASKVEVSK